MTIAAFGDGDNLGLIRALLNKVINNSRTFATNNSTDSNAPVVLNCGRNIVMPDAVDPLYFLLPSALADTRVELIRVTTTANAPINVARNGTDTINTEAADAVWITSSPVSMLVFECTTDGAWFTNGLLNN